MPERRPSMSPRGRPSFSQPYSPTPPSAMAEVRLDRSASNASLQVPSDRSQESDSDAVSLHSTMSIQAAPLSWVHTTVGDLVQIDKLVSADYKISVEMAYEILSKHNLTCLPLSKNGSIFDFFDYADLCGYLLLVLGHITVKDERSPEFFESLKKARAGKPASVGFASQFGSAHDPFVKIPAHITLVAAFEKFAMGVHRIAVTSSATNEVIGILSQRRMIRYIWNNMRKFPNLESSLDSTLEENQIGTYGSVVTVNGDQPVLEALDIMHESAVSSVAVVDHNQQLLGNISVVDVSLLTRAWQIGLLQQSCKYFLSVILDHRGIAYGGNESVPVFYVHKDTNLAKVMATMIATRAHRLWICEKCEDASQSGKLIGVVSLTDLLNFVARKAGNSKIDPETARRHRRSSSSSVRSSSRVRSVLADKNDRR